MLQALRGPGRSRLSLIQSLIHPADPWQTFVLVSLGVEKSQGISTLLGRRGQGLEGDGGSVPRALEHIHSRHVLVVLVFVCPKGQIHPCSVDGHTS